MLNKKIIKALVSGFLACSLIFSASTSSFAQNGKVDTTATGEKVIVLNESESEPELYVPQAFTKLVTLDRVNLRKGPSTSHDVIKTLNRGTEVEFVNYETIDGEVNGWALVRYNTDIGYIKSEFIGTKEALPGGGNVTLTHWNEAKQIFTIGVAAEIYDVYSGLTYYVKSFSNGSHADVEPITKEDTDIMFKTYGNKWKWDPRPVWVTINGYKMAASINGMPHGGGVNNSNGMNGQVCLHFLGSSTHNGNSSFTKWHQDVLMEAYNLSK